MLIKSGGDWMRLSAVILSVLLSLWPLTSASAQDATMDADQSQREESFKADLIARLTAAGVQESDIMVTYRDDLQDYEILIGGGTLTDEGIAHIRTATRMAGIVTFEDSENAARLHAQEAVEGRALMRNMGAELRASTPGLPVYDPAAMSLADFATALETYAGFQSRQVLSVRENETLRIGPVIGPIDSDRSRKLFNAITATLFDHEEVNVVLVGEDGA
jgi:hypothetical protein